MLALPVAVAAAAAVVVHGQSVPWIAKLSLGVDYYPETWDSARWEVDAAAMAAANMTTVRVAEFAWHKIQPYDGAPYNFTWLDRALDVLYAHGIRAIIGTPTASPPEWLYKKDPTISLVTASGARVGTGARQNMNHLHPLIVSSTRDIVTAMGAHYANDSRVAAFQIDNEIHGEYDYSAITQAGFAVWLAKKYGGSTGVMNDAWGTQFWGEEYNAFGDVPLPWDSTDGHNPGLALDYRRFIADVGAGYLELQAGILRAVAPGKPLTHNCMGLYNNVDYSRFGAALDAVSFDNYPLSWFSTTAAPPDYTHIEEGTIYNNALNLAAMRGAKGQRPFFVMEHQVSNTGQWYYYGSGWSAGYRLAAWQSIANGADGLQFFRWRTSRWGQEQHWEGVLNWDGSTTAPRYTRVAALGAELAAASPFVFGGRVRARVAVLYSIESEWAFAEQPLTGVPFSTQPAMRGLLAAWRARGEGVDVVYVPADAGAPGGAPLPDLAGYAVVMAPSLYVAPAPLAAALLAFAHAGGALLLSMRAGAKDAANAYVGTPLPGLFAGAAGVTMDEWDPMCSLGEADVALAAGGPPVPLSATQGRICELLVPTPGGGARVLGAYAAGVHAGRAALTSAAHGAGTVVYAGAASDAAAWYEALAAELARGAGLPWPAARLPAGVEASVRDLPSGASAAFLLNWSNATQRVAFAPAANGVDVLRGGAPVGPDGLVTLEPYGVAVVAVAAAGLL